MRSPVPESRYMTLGVGDEQHGLETPQGAVGPPVARQLHGRTLEVAPMLFELALEPAEQRKSIGGGARKASEDAVVVQAAHLARLMLDDGLAERDLAVAGQHDLPLWRTASTVVA